MKIAIITGASSGMGAEFVKQLDACACDELWLVARRRERMEKLAEECSTPTRVFALDLLEPASFEELRGELDKCGGKVAWLINSAGFGEFGEVGVQPLETQMRMIDLNVKTTVAACNVFLAYMERGSHMVNLGSGSVFNPLPYFNVYSSTKAFVFQYSRALHYELKPRGIYVSVFCPGWVRTEFFDHTRDRDKNVRSPKAYKPMTEPDRVVAYCMKHAKKGKEVIVNGWYTKTQHLLSKILPRRFLINAWLGMLEEKK